MQARASHGDVTFALVVPAWLHGLDWVGDPHASRPCATRQLKMLAALAGAAGLLIELADIGDPSATSLARPARDRSLHRRPDSGEVNVPS